MAIAVLLLASLYMVLIAVLVALGAGGVVVGIVVGLLFLGQYFACEPLALAALGAREVTAAQAPALHAIVERLCVEADLPMPRLAVTPSAMPNAFSVGRTPSRGIICATTGLSEQLGESELAAVLAHELTHIAQRDVMVMTIASVFASVAAFIARLGGRIDDADDAAAGDGPSFAPVAILSGLVFLVSYVLIRSLSHDREFVADRGSATITGAPDALAAALVTISEHVERSSQRDLRGACGELAAFYVIAPDIRATVATLCGTHPPLQARLQALTRLHGAAVH